MPQIDAEWIFAKDTTGMSIGDLAKKALKSETLGYIEKLLREILQNLVDRRISPSIWASIRIVVLNGKKKDLFLKSSKLELLAPHLEASESEKTRLGSELIHDSNEIVCLYIEGFGTEGLTGDEFASGNYAGLIRSMGRSRQSSEISGGKHGVGKAVQSEASDIKSAIYYSMPKDEESRLVGVCRIDSHKVGQQPYHGQGTFGFRYQADEGPEMDACVSIRGSDADNLAKDLGFRIRDKEQTGTSICIPFFRVPDSNSPDKIADRIETVVKKWFFPALKGYTGFELSVEIESHEGEKRTLEFGPNDDEHVFSDFPICDWKDHLEKRDSEFDDGEIIARTFRTPLPPDMDDGHGPIGSGKDAEVLVLLKKVSNHEYSNRVALIRSQGMVLEYIEYPPLSVSGHDFTGICFIGTSIYRSGSWDNPGVRDKNLEKFISECEPPAHDYIDKNADTAVEKYGARTTKRCVTQFYKKLKEVTREATQKPSPDDGKRVDELSKLTPFGSGGLPKPGKGQITLSNDKFSPLGNGLWKMNYQFMATLKPPKFTEWDLTIDVRMNTIKSGNGEGRFTLSDIQISDPDIGILHSSSHGGNPTGIEFNTTEDDDGNVIAISLSGITTESPVINMIASAPSIGIPVELIAPLVHYETVRRGYSDAE